MHFRLRGLFGTFLLESIADLNFVSSEINKQVSENRGRFSKGGFGICQSASLGSETVFLLYLSRERFSTSLLAGCGKTMARPKMLSAFRDCCD
jgi:hypothetical protein